MRFPVWRELKLGVGCWGGTHDHPFHEVSRLKGIETQRVKNPSPIWTKLLSMRFPVWRELKLANGFRHLYTVFKLSMRFPVWRELKLWTHWDTAVSSATSLSMRFPVWRELKLIIDCQSSVCLTILSMRFPVWRELKRGVYPDLAKSISAFVLSMRFPVWRELKLRHNCNGWATFTRILSMRFPVWRELKLVCSLDVSFPILSFHEVSRLKGIETVLQATLSWHLLPSFHEVSRWKGIETLIEQNGFYTILTFPWGFPLEGNWNCNDNWVSGAVDSKFLSMRFPFEGNWNLNEPESAVTSTVAFHEVSRWKGIETRPAVRGLAASGLTTPPKKTVPFKAHQNAQPKTKPYPFNPHLKGPPAWRDVCLRTNRYHKPWDVKASGGCVKGLRLLFGVQQTSRAFIQTREIFSLECFSGGGSRGQEPKATNMWKCERVHTCRYADVILCRCDGLHIEIKTLDFRDWLRVWTQIFGKQLQSLIGKKLTDIYQSYHEVSNHQEIGGIARWKCDGFEKDAWFLAHEMAS